MLQFTAVRDLRVSSGEEGNRIVGPNAQILLLIILSMLCVAVSLRTQIANSFTVLLSGRFDGTIEVTILEHWYNVFGGFESWGTTSYFYPYLGTLAYNDGYFFYGLIYSVLRYAGFDPYLSSELVNVTLRLIGFISFYIFLHRVFRLSFGWSAFGAVLFSVGNSMMLHAVHEQLLTIGFVPLLAVLVQEALIGLVRQDGGRRFLLWGTATAILIGVWFMTAFYMAWFTLFFMLFLTPALFLLASRGQRGALIAGLRRRWQSATLLALLLVLCLLPFLSLYLPKAQSTGMWSFSEPAYYTLAPMDVVHVGGWNLLWGRADQWLYHRFNPDSAVFSEHTVGFAPILLATFLFGAWRVWRGKIGPLDGLLTRAVVLATIISWIFVFHFKNLHPWHMIFEGVPGARGLRVVARYQLFLAVPVTAIAVVSLAQIKSRGFGVILTLLCTAVLAEEITDYEPLVRFNRQHETALLRATPPAPEECRAFFVSNPREHMDPDTELNIDAMILSETHHLPTINGVSTFNPPDGKFTDKDHSEYLDHVRDYASRHRIEGLCGLDLRRFTWSTEPFSTARVEDFRHS